MVLENIQLPAKEKFEWEIRSAEVKDAEKILNIGEISWLDTYAHDDDTRKQWQKRFGRKTQDQKIESVVTTILDNKSIVTVVANKANQTIAGYSHLILGESKIWALYIHPDFQGKGAGAKLMSSALKTLEAANNLISLEIANSNQKARSFYEGFGFVMDTNIIPDFSLKIDDEGNEIKIPQSRMIRPAGPLTK